MKTHTIVALFTLVALSCQLSAKTINQDYEVEESDAKMVLKRSRRGWLGEAFPMFKKDRRDCDEDDSDREECQTQRPRDEGVDYWKLAGMLFSYVTNSFSLEGF